ncbi:MAG: putative DNA binding domain-containing protein [Muribaculaceae bacterium]|nr:putative DNA binding domain-containing protein [Muribaculaceae bacterium]
MKDIPAIKGKFYIRRLIEEGEHEHQDFKYAITDARKIARSISAFANNDGGRLLVGVKDNGSIVGVPNEEDIYMVEHAAEAYCRPAQKVEVDAFIADGGAIVLRVNIARAAMRPVYCLEEGGKTVAYYRVADENISAHPLMVRAWELSSTDTPAGFSFTDDELGALSLIEQMQPLTPEQYFRHVRLSRHRAEELLVRLLALGSISMKHTSGGFLIVTSAD